MTRDPYVVLGVSRNASSDEVKKAYRDLSKKYHPDSHMDNPLSDLAEEKFKEVQSAYDQIMNNTTGSYSQSSTSASYSNGGYGAGGNSTSGEMSDVYNFLYNRRFQDAMRVLNNISNRDAKWYYFSALANNGLGNNILAAEHARIANQMEPGNRDYQNLVNQLQFRTNQYQGMGQQYGRNRVGTGNFCCDLLCADALCECMGGDLCGCC